MSFPEWFDKLPNEAQRAALAVTHIENVTLATVLKALELTDGFSDGWQEERSIDDYLMAIRCAVRSIVRKPRPLAELVSLEAYRAARAVKSMIFPKHYFAPSSVITQKGNHYRWLMAKLAHSVITPKGEAVTEITKLAKQFRAAAAELDTLATNAPAVELGTLRRAAYAVRVQVANVAKRSGASRSTLSTNQQKEEPVFTVVDADGAR